MYNCLMFTFSKKYVYVRQSFTKAYTSVYLNNKAKNFWQKINETWYYNQVKKRKKKFLNSKKMTR